MQDTGNAPKADNCAGRKVAEDKEMEGVVMVKAKLTTDGKSLFIDGKKVIRGWESFTGWFWFATEEAYKQDSLLPNGKEVKNDVFYFGFVQGQEQEWGDFSLAELENLKPKVWEIPKKNLMYSGRRRGLLTKDFPGTYWTGSEKKAYIKR